jgi:ABC-type spermidine/putrescine transport system permease subunit I
MGRVVQEGDPGAIEVRASADRGAGGADRPALALLALLLLALSSLIAASVVVPGGKWYGHYRKFLGDDLYVAYIYRSFRVAAYTTVARSSSATRSRAR